jgi:hypothetical protein
MNDLVMPETVASQLQGLPHPVNLCDSAGKILGCFVPLIDPSLYEVVGGEPTGAELDEIEKSGEWYTSDEVLRHLENLG